MLDWIIFPIEQLATKGNGAGAISAKREKTDCDLKSAPKLTPRRPTTCNRSLGIYRQRLKKSTHDFFTGREISAVTHAEFISTWSPGNSNEQCVSD
jgi:hypothetical protein